VFRAKESVRIPFKFQSFAGGQIAAAEFNPSQASVCEGPRLPFAHEEPIKRREISVSIYNQRGSAVAQLLVCVEPQNFVIDQTFWFVHWSNDMFKQAIRVSQTPATSAACHVVCNSAQVVCTASRGRQGTISDVVLRCHCGKAGEAKRFFLLLYADRFASQLLECWQVVIDVYERQDLTGQAGQTTSATLAVKGLTAPTLACFHTSAPNEIAFRTGEVSLAPDVQNETQMSFLPLNIGRKEVLVHVVDVSSGRLVHGRVVYTAATSPPITRAFKIDLRAGGGSSNKRVGYQNPYGCQKSLRLRTNEPDILRFRDATLAVGPHEVKQIGLSFTAPERPPAAPMVVLIFINDADTDKTLDCLAVTVSF
jgi:hypothetical protein